MANVDWARDTRLWYRANYYRVRDTLRNVHHAALDSVPPGSSGTYRDALGEARGVIEPLDLGVIYTIESTFGTSAYGPGTNILGGFQLSKATAETYSLDPEPTLVDDVDDRGEDVRVEWTGDTLDEIENGIDPRWTDDREDDAAELERVATIACRYIFQLARHLTWGGYGSLQHNTRRASHDEDGELYVEVQKPSPAELGEVLRVRGGLLDQLFEETITHVDEARGSPNSFRKRLEKDIRRSGGGEVEESESEPLGHVASYLGDWFDASVSAVGPRGAAQDLGGVSDDDRDEMRKLVYAGYNKGPATLFVSRLRAYLDARSAGKNDDDARKAMYDWSAVGDHVIGETRSYIQKMDDIRPIMACPPGVEIVGVTFNPEGTDAPDENDEVVRIKNNDDGPIVLNGWRISDGEDEVVLEADSEARVAKGGVREVPLGEASGLSGGQGRPMLDNDDGDNLSLEYVDGETLAYFAYDVRETALADGGDVDLIRNENSGQTHLVEIDCGHRPDPGNREHTTGSAPSCYYCADEGQVDVQVERWWTVTETDPERSLSRERDEQTVEEVGEDCSDWPDRVD